MLHSLQRFPALLQRIFRLGADDEVFQLAREAQAVLARGERVRREGLRLFLVSLLQRLELGELFRRVRSFLLVLIPPSPPISPAA